MTQILVLARFYLFPWIIYNNNTMNLNLFLIGTLHVNQSISTLFAKIASHQKTEKHIKKFRKITN